MCHRKIPDVKLPSGSKKKKKKKKKIALTKKRQDLSNYSNNCFTDLVQLRLIYSDFNVCVVNFR